MMTSIHSFTLNFYKPNKDSISWSKSNWQINILKIYKDVINNTNSVDIKIIITECLQKILYVGNLFK